MRSRTPCSRRSSPVTFSPSSVSRTRICVASAADEQVALPCREQVALIERHAGGRDRRRPVLDRLLHAGLRRALVDLRAAVVDAVADHRPAVVLALLDDVDLVAAARAVLVRPQLAGRRMQRRALHIAVAVAPDFRLGVACARRTDCRSAPRRPARRARSCRCGCRGSAPPADRSRDRPWSGTGCCRASARCGSRNAGRSTAGLPAGRSPSRRRACRRRAGRAPSRCGRRRRADRRSRNRWSGSARSCGRARRHAARPGSTQTPSARRRAAATACRRATMRSRPGRSVTSMRPSGRKASAQGLSSPLTTVSTARSPAEDL